MFLVLAFKELLIKADNIRTIHKHINPVVDNVRVIAMQIINDSRIFIHFEKDLQLMVQVMPVHNIKQEKLASPTPTPKIPFLT